MKHGVVVVLLFFLAGFCWSGDFPLRVKDATGTPFRFEKAPRTVISIIPSATEILFELGLEKRILAVSDNDNYPPAVKKKPTVGGMKINAEVILSLNPGIIIGEAGLNAGAIEDLRKLNLRVFIIHAENIEEVQKNILLLGKLFNRKREAAAVVDGMEKERQLVFIRLNRAPPLKKVKVFIEHFPGLYTAGTGTFMHEIITLAGGDNIAAPIHEWGRMTEEEVVHQAPEVILYTDGHTLNGNGTGLRKLIMGRSAWANIPAVKNHRVIGIQKDLISRPCPRLTKGLVAVAGVLYPDRFADIAAEGILE